MPLKFMVSVCKLKGLVKPLDFYLLNKWTLCDRATCNLYPGQPVFWLISNARLLRGQQKHKKDCGNLVFRRSSCTYLFNIYALNIMTILL